MSSRKKSFSVSWLSIAFWIVVTATAAFLLLPTLVIIPVSFTTQAALDFPPRGFSLKWYAEIWSNPMWSDAIVSSLKVGLLTALAATVFGTLTALGVSLLRGVEGRFGEGVALAPLVTPVITLSIGIYMTFAKWGLAGTTIGLAIAHTVLAIPFVVVSVRASLETVNPNLQLASLGLGASRWLTFHRVLLPLIMPGVVAGAILAFMTSWDEVVVALFLSSPAVRTIPVVIWAQVRADISPTVAAVATLLIVVSAVGLSAATFIGRHQKK